MIVHIIARDKFTNGYIKFMLNEYKDIEQIFFTKRGNYKIDIYDNNEIYEIKNLKELNASELKKNCM